MEIQIISKGNFISKTKAPFLMFKEHRVETHYWVHFNFKLILSRFLETMQETWIRSLGQEDSLEKRMATHSIILAWETPRKEEPEGLQSMGSHSQKQLSN